MMPGNSNSFAAKSNAKFLPKGLLLGGREFGFGERHLCGVISNLGFAASVLASLICDGVRLRADAGLVVWFLSAPYQCSFAERRFCRVALAQDSSFCTGWFASS